MSLFVGNISKTVKQSEVEDEFKKFGQCVYRNKGNFSFVEYEDENAADDAKEALDQKEFGGTPLNIEWSKKSKKFDAAQESKRPPSKKREERCHNCDKTGHFVRDCKQRRRSRSRSNDRRDSGNSSRYRRDDRDSRGRSGRMRSRSPPRRSSRRSRSRSPPRRHRDDRDKRDNRRDSYRRSDNDRDDRRRGGDDRDNRRDRSRRDSSPPREDRPRRRSVSQSPRSPRSPPRREDSARHEAKGNSQQGGVEDRRD